MNARGLEVITETTAIFHKLEPNKATNRKLVFNGVVPHSATGMSLIKASFLSMQRREENPGAFGDKISVILTA